MFDTFRGQCDEEVWGINYYKVIHAQVSRGNMLK